jgi:hypothetical protein
MMTRDAMSRSDKSEEFLLIGEALGHGQEQPVSFNTAPSTDLSH